MRALTLVIVIPNVVPPLLRVSSPLLTTVPLSMTRAFMARAVPSVSVPVSMAMTMAMPTSMLPGMMGPAAIPVVAMLLLVTSPPAILR